MSTQPDRDAQIEAVVQQVRRRLQQQWPDSDQTLDQIEEIAGRIGGQVSQEVQEHLTRKQTPPPTKNQTCDCGARARYKGQQARSLITLHGVLVWRRAIYHCPTCQQSLAPADRLLGLDAGSTTTSVRQRAAYLAALLPFAQAATTLSLLNGVHLSPASVERLACAVGNALRDAQHRDAQAHHEDRLPQPTDTGSQRLYIGMDGVFVPLRDAWKKDQSAGTLHCRYGECKLGVVYQAHSDKNGQDTRVKTRAYVATLHNAETFGPLLGTLAHQHGHHQSRDVVVLADGAAWIWQIAAKQFSGATQIVDFFHASQHLAHVAEARFGATEAAKQWLAARQAELLNDDLALVLADLQAWHPSSTSKKELRRTTYAYFYDNAARMRYKTFRERGCYIGSGVVEAGCKQVATQRMKQSGMHWRQETAEAILTLRAAQLSTNPPDLRPYCTMPA